MFPFDDVITINTIDSPHIAAEYNTTMDTIGRKEAKTLLRLQWCHNEHDGVSNHQPHDYLLNRLCGRRSKTLKLRVTGLCAGNSPMKMFPFDDVIMQNMNLTSELWVIGLFGEKILQAIESTLYFAIMQSI